MEMNDWKLFSASEYIIKQINFKYFLEIIIKYYLIVDSL